MATGNFISYLRVSTERQGLSGLGLEAQRAAIETHLNGGNWTLLKEYIEVESGKNNERPQLAKALAECKATGSQLLIAKLDRLSRDAYFLIGLQKSAVKFVAVDMPDANDLTVGIMALIAEQERKAISERTKAALQAAKARGIKLGNPQNLTTEAAQKGRAKGAKAIVSKADQFAIETYPRVKHLRDQGLSLNAVARQLNQEHVLTARGKSGAWTPAAVKNLLARVEKG